MRFFDTVITAFPEHFDGKVLDVGSLDINGGHHHLLKSKEYVGVDVSAGKNVSLVASGNEIDLPSGYFDAAMSSECFEHNPFWRGTLHNMIRLTKNQGGLVVFSCASPGRQEHGTTRSDDGYASPLTVQAGQEYYQNVSKRQVKAMFGESEFLSFRLWQDLRVNDLYFVGVKNSPSMNPDFKQDLITRLNLVDKKMKSFLLQESIRLPLNYVFRYCYQPAYRLLRRIYSNQ
jgi:SAM-dependent methyltransferase